MNLTTHHTRLGREPFVVYELIENKPLDKESIIHQPRIVADVAYNQTNMSAAGYALKARRLADDATSDDDLETAYRFLQTALNALS
jgi:hypothetical protein